MDQSTMPPYEGAAAPVTPTPASDAAGPSGCAPVNSRRTSVILREFLASHPEPRISLGDLRDALDDRGFGVLIFFFALPNLVPVNVPLLSAVLGAPLVLLAAQLSYGRHQPWFPNWLARQSFPREGLTSAMAKALPVLERIESLLRPRLLSILSWTGERMIGVALLILAVVLTLPIPLGNWLPAFAIAIIGLAIVEKDGVAVVVGLVIGVISLFIAGAVVVGLLKAAFYFLGTMF